MSITKSTVTEDLKQVEELSNLKAALATLLQEEVTGFDIQHSSDKKTKIISIAPDRAGAFLKKLEEVFKSHGHTRAHIPYRLVVQKAKETPVPVKPTNVGRSVLSEEEVQIPLPGFELLNINDIIKGKESAQVLLPRLIDAEMQKNIGNISGWKPVLGQDGQIIYRYDCALSKVETNLRRAQIELLKQVLSEATWQDLYKAFAEEDFIPIQSSFVSTGFKGPLNPHIEGLFQFRSDETTHRSYVLFDCIGLAKCILAPQFVLNPPASTAALSTVSASALSVSTSSLSLTRSKTDSTSSVSSLSATSTQSSLSTQSRDSSSSFPSEPEEEGDSEEVASGFATIAFDSEHFMNYMSTLLTQNILLKPEQQGAQTKCRPLVFHRGQAIQSTIVIDFGVDSSGSMRKVYGELKSKLKETLQKLSKTLDINATFIRLKRFGSSVEVESGKGKNTKDKFKSVVIPLSKMDKLFAEIDSWPTPEEGELTAIFEYLCNEVTELRKHPGNKILVLVSDGIDKNSPDKFKPGTLNNNLLPAVSSMDKGENPIQFYSLEIGSEIEETVLEKIRVITNGQRIPMGAALEDSNAFFKEIPKFRIAKYFMHFVQEVQSHQVTFRVQVADDQISMAAGVEHFIDPALPFSVNGKLYRATEPDPAAHQTLALDSSSDTKREEEQHMSLDTQRLAMQLAHQQSLDLQEKLQSTHQQEKAALQQELEAAKRDALAAEERATQTALQLAAQTVAYASQTEAQVKEIQQLKDTMQSMKAAHQVQESALQQLLQQTETRLQSETQRQSLEIKNLAEADQQKQGRLAMLEAMAEEFKQFKEQLAQQQALSAQQAQTATTTTASAFTRESVSTSSATTASDSSLSASDQPAPTLTPGYKASTTVSKKPYGPERPSTSSKSTGGGKSGKPEGGRCVIS